MSAEPSLQFIDTNILVYAYDPSAGVKHQRAVALMASLWVSRRGCLSVQVLQEFYVVSTRKLAHLASADLRTIVHDLGKWRMHRPGAADVLNAVDLHLGMQVSFWDAMILHKIYPEYCG